LLNRKSRATKQATANIVLQMTAVSSTVEYLYRDLTMSCINLNISKSYRSRLRPMTNNL
jgi:hypothetical protein